jgi:membrane-bound metal-dependent hydrolase YbcI (DUF457 family)
MPFAFTHLIGAWIAGKLFEWKGRKLTKIEWALLLGGGILPDFDFIVHWTTNIEAHRYLTHSLFFAAIISLLVLILASLLKKKWPFFNTKSYAIAIFCGILIHLLLDMFNSVGIPLLWPYPMYISYFGTAISYVSTAMNVEAYQALFREAIFDASLGVLWVGYFVIRDKIKF